MNNNHLEQFDSQRRNAIEQILKIFKSANQAEILQLPEQITSDSRGQITKVINPDTNSKQENKDQKKSVEDKKKETTIFGDFMEKLGDAYEEKSISNPSFPHLDAISSGILLMMQEISKKYNLRLMTEKDIVENMSPLIDNIISAAMLVVYEGNLDLAVTEFDEQVIKRIDQKLQTLPTNKELEPEAIWQKETAIFFANIIKRAKKILEELSIELNNETRVNFEFNERTLASYDREKIRILQKVLTERVYKTSNLKYKEFSKDLMSRNALKAKELYTLYSKLDMNRENQPKDLLYAPSSVLVWVNTQIILLTLGKTGNYFEKADLDQFVEYLKKLQLDGDSDKRFVEKLNETANDLILKSLSTKNKELTDKEKNYLEHTIKESLNKLIKYLSDENQVKKYLNRTPDPEGAPFFISVPVENIDAEQAAVDEIKLNKSISLIKAKNMISNHGISVKILNEIFQRLKSEGDKSEFVDVLLTYKLSPESVNYLVEQGLLSLSNTILWQYLDLLPREYVLKNFKKISNFNIIHAEDKEIRNLIKFIKTLSEIEIRNLVLDDEHFHFFVALFELAKKLEILKIKEKLYSDLIVDLLLKQYISFRYVNFTEKDSIKDEFPEYEWKSKQAIKSFAKLSQFDSSKAAEIINSLSEEEAFLKFNNNNQDLLKEYCSARDKYFAEISKPKKKKTTKVVKSTKTPAKPKAKEAKPQTPPPPKKRPNSKAK